MEKHITRRDIDTALQQNSRTVRSAELACRQDTVQILNLSTIRELIRQAVEDTLSTAGARPDGRQLKKILRDAEAEFREKLVALEAEKAGAEAHSRDVEKRLAETEMLLNEERDTNAPPPSFTVPEEGVEEIRQRFERLLKHATQEGHIGSRGEADLRSLIASLLDEERAKIEVQLARAQKDKIALFQKKVERLVSPLKRAYQERDNAREFAESIRALGTLPLGKSMIPGLSASDPNRRRKIDLLKEIVIANREFRKCLAK